MIFINGKKIDKTEYAITFMNKYRPFDKLVLYFTTILDKGDYIDIFYIPEILVEKYKQVSIPKSGLLTLTDTPIDVNYPTTYPLSKDTCMLFINGLKVNPMDIKDIDLNTLLINMDKYVRDTNGNIVIDGTNNKSESRHYVDSVDNVTIMEYITGNSEIAKYLYKNGKSITDTWKTFINTLLTTYAESGKSYAGLQKIFGTIYELESPAENYKDNFASLKTMTSIWDVMMSVLEISLSMTSILSILITKQKAVIPRLYVYSPIRINYSIILLLILLLIQKMLKMDKSLFLLIVKINNCGRDLCPFRFLIIQNFTCIV